MKILLALLGWLVWNASIFVIKKDEYDTQHKPMPLLDYARENYDNWALSLLFVPLILAFGHYQWQIELFAMPAQITWREYYILGAGAFCEAALFFIRKFKEKYK